MRTGLFLLAGVLLLAGAFVLAKLFSGHYPNAARTALFTFVAVWFALTAFNMWVGVSKAGYALTEELPIFLLLFGIPAAIAAIVSWKVL